MIRPNARRVRAAVVVVAAATMLAGCGSGSGGGNDNSSNGTSSLTPQQIYTTGIVGNTADPGTPKQGGVLTVADYTEPTSLDPTKTIANGAAGGNALAAIYDVLMRYDQGSQKFVPELAESLTGSKNNTVWTLKLRPGVKFSDGTPLTAASVLGSIGYYEKNAGFNTLLLATNIKSMAPVGQDTVVFTMNRSWAEFPAMLAAGPGMILAPAAYAGGPDKFKAVGAGPFELGTYKPNESLTLNVNPGYYGDKPYLSGLKFIWPGSDDAKMGELKAGQADVASIRNAKSVLTARQAGYSGDMVTSGLASYLEINNRKGHPGYSQQIRQAINYAIDPKSFDERINNGDGLPTKSVYAPSQPYYKDIALANYDLAKAKSLVAAAKKSGFNGKLTIIGQADQQSQTGGVLIKAMLDAAGFDATYQALTNVADQIQKIYVTHDFDLAFGGGGVTSESPYASLATNLDSKSPQNPTGYANPAMDKLLVQLQAAEGTARTAVLTKINELWQQTIPGVVMSAGGFFMPWNKNVHGIVPSTQYLLLFNKAWKS